MRSDKFKAYKLRVEGRSYNEIQKLLGIPKSTLSAWFADLELPQKAKNRLAQRTYQKSTAAILKHNRTQTSMAQQNARNIRDTAKAEIKQLSERDVLMLGTSLYWAEGYKRPKMENGKIKTHHSVSLSNSDPALVKVYMRYLRETCRVPEEKISAEVRIYEHQNEAYLLNFWSKITKLPYGRFKKFYYGVSLSGQHKKPFNILPYGTIQIRVNSTELYHKIMGWIEGLSEI